MRIRWMVLVLAVLAGGVPGWAAEGCSEVPLYSWCDVVYELGETDAAAHPNPYASVDVWAEFRGPDFRTKRVFGFWDGGKRFVFRFAPLETGEHVYRLSSNAKSLDGKQGTFNAVASDSPGFVIPQNVHHWMHTERLIPHLWMGDTCYRFAFVDRGQFESYVKARAAQKFNHMRGLLIGNKELAAKAFPSADRPNPEHFREVDYRVDFLNRNGIIVDLILGGDQNHLAELFPESEQRKRYIRYVAARYAAMNVTWQLVQEFEEYENGRALLKEMGLWLKDMDPYRHPRTTHTVATSGPLLGDGWMDHILYQSDSVELGAIEHQLYPFPQVNAEFGYEDSGAGKTHPHHVSSNEFRRRLWHATMNGQYPTFGNTGTYTARKDFIDMKHVDTPGAKAMSVWFDVLSRTRHWELEPYFELTGGRCIALHDAEYLIYLEKPGQVEILVPKRTYQVYWIDPATGETIKEKKDFKGSTRFIGQPPTNDRDWVLHLSRDGRKEGLAKSYKFESRRILMQEVEASAAKVPYKIVQPSGEISLQGEHPFEAELTRETRATSEMIWLWTGDVTTDGLGYRVIGTGQKGTLRIRRGMAKRYPATLHVRLYGMNGVGKVYSLDTVVRVKE